MREIPRAELEERHQLDLGIACAYHGCGAQVGCECRDVKAGMVHFQRRIQRLLADQADSTIPTG